MASGLRNYDAWLEAPYQRAQREVGEEDLMDARVYVAEEDEWATVDEAEEWEDAEGDGEGGVQRYGGVTYSLRVDGTRRDVSMDEPELASLVAEQQASELALCDPRIIEQLERWLSMASRGYASEPDDVRERREARCAKYARELAAARGYQEAAR